MMQLSVTQELTLVATGVGVGLILLSALAVLGLMWVFGQVMDAIGRRERTQAELTTKYGEGKYGEIQNR